MKGDIVVSTFGVLHRDSGQTRDLGNLRAPVALCGVAVSQTSDQPARLDCPKCAQIAAAVSA